MPALLCAILAAGVEEGHVSISSISVLPFASFPHSPIATDKRGYPHIIFLIS